MHAYWSCTIHVVPNEEVEYDSVQEDPTAGDSSLVVMTPNPSYAQLP